MRSRILFQMPRKLFFYLFALKVFTISFVRSFGGFLCGKKKSVEGDSDSLCVQNSNANRQNKLNCKKLFSLSLSVCCIVLLTFQPPKAQIVSFEMKVFCKILFLHWAAVVAQLVERSLPTPERPTVL